MAGYNTSRRPAKWQAGTADDRMADRLMQKSESIQAKAAEKGLGGETGQPIAQASPLHYVLGKSGTRPAMKRAGRLLAAEQEDDTRTAMRFQTVPDY